MDIIKSVGFIAGFLTTICSLPQLIKIWKTKQAKDLSLAMYILLFIGMYMWLFYGILINAQPMIMWNAVSLVLISTVLGLKLKYG